MLAVLLSLCLVAPQVRPNVVVVVWDDVGDRDAVPALTPNLHAMAAQGVRFRRAYSHGWCAPTRDSLLRGAVLGRARGDACLPPTSESGDHGALNIAKVFDGQGYRTLYTGKWHGGSSDVGSWPATLSVQGWDDVRAALPVGPTCGIGPGSVRIDDGVASQRGTPSTAETATVRDALLSWWAATPPPRLAMVNFKSAHSPYELPPQDVLPPGYAPPIEPTQRDLYEAEVRSLDFVLGQILSVVGPDTYVVVLGDNGTPADVPGPGQDPSRLKLTSYEGGVRIPLVVRGPGLAIGHESQALVHVADVLPTLARIVDVKPRLVVDGRTFVGPLIGLAGSRETVFVWSDPLLDTAMIGRRWKLLTRADGVEELYDLENDPLEQAPLPPVGPEAEALRAERDAVMAGG